MHHGVGRNGRDYRDYWLDLVDEAGILAISIEFPEALSIGDLLLVLAISLVTSKGAHGVPGSAIVILAATLNAVPSIPAIGLVLVLPLANRDAVREHIRAALLEHGATGIVASGACGADLLAQEVARELKLPHRRMILPFAPDTFVTAPSPIGQVIGDPCSMIS